MYISIVVLENRPNHQIFLRNIYNISFIYLLNGNIHHLSKSVYENIFFKTTSTSHICNCYQLDLFDIVWAIRADLNTQ